MLRWFLLLNCSLFLLLGCSLKEDSAMLLKPLAKIEKPLSVNMLWSRYDSNGFGDNNNLMKPVVTGQEVFTVDQDGRVRVYHKSNGDYLWSLFLNQSVANGLAKSGNYLIIGTVTGNVVAVDVKRHIIIWEHKVSSEIVETPIINKNLVIVRSGDGKVVALDLLSGKQSWVYAQRMPVLSLKGAGAPVIEDDKIIVGFANGKVVALRLRDGFMLWDVTVSVPKGSSELERIVDLDADLILQDGIVYAMSYQGNITAVETETGTVLWSKEHSSYAGATIQGDVIYLTDDESHVWALDISNGASIWKQSVLSDRLLTKPIVINDYLVAGDGYGYLHWFSKDDGRIIGRYFVDAGGVSVPVVEDNDLYILSNTGQVKALTLNDVGELTGIFR
ncbi:MAG: outer membrane protein assembly factor BamB [Methylococcales bacterium]|jgi:outer membrane protein assembly factor BamB|nr:outer membrane protein assembly factor BamB [Methylococcales bacterium]MBT7410909.1 outer membrane protein assembly factor BamB [Methylococcales bacterium]